MDTLGTFSHWVDSVLDFSVEVFNQLVPFIIAGIIIISVVFFRDLVSKIRQIERKPRSILLTGSIDKKNRKKIDVRHFDITHSIMGKRRIPRETSPLSISNLIARKRQNKLYPHLLDATKSVPGNKLKAQESRLITLTLVDDTEKIDADMSREDYETSGLGLMNDLKELATENIKTDIKVDDVKSHLRNEIQRARDIVAKYLEIKSIRDEESKSLFKPIKDALREMEGDLAEQNVDIKIRSSDYDVDIEMGNNSSLTISRYGNSSYFQVVERQEFDLPEPYFYETEREFQNYSMVIDYVSKSIARHIALKEYGALNLPKTVIKNISAPQGHSPSKQVLDHARIWDRSDPKTEGSNAGFSGKTSSSSGN
jgi:hypothetical protein